MARGEKKSPYIFKLEQVNEKSPAAVLNIFHSLENDNSELRKEDFGRALASITHPSIREEVAEKIKGYTSSSDNGVNEFRRKMIESLRPAS